MLWDIIKLLITAVITFFGTHIWSKWQTKRRSLCYEHKPRFSLLGFDIMKPLLEDREMGIGEMVALDGYQVRVFNDGNVPIENQKISFKFRAGAIILNSFYQTIPQEGVIEGQVSSQNVLNNTREYTLKTLNPIRKFKDEANFFFLVYNADNNPEVAARASGLLCHQKERGDKRVYYFTTLIDILFGLLLIFYLLDKLILKVTSTNILGYVLFIYYLLVLILRLLLLFKQRKVVLKKVI